MDIIKQVCVTLLRLAAMAALGIGLGFLGRNLRTASGQPGEAPPARPLEHTSAFDLFKRDVHPLLTREENGD
ncbi:MAG: hypothetical protein HYZ36_06855, partial [Pedosphaera parvula]|nr:hypothetical protein [Pedosphaera parvula]